MTVVLRDRIYCTVNQPSCQRGGLWRWGAFMVHIVLLTAKIRVFFRQGVLSMGCPWHSFQRQMNVSANMRMLGVDCI